MLNPIIILPLALAIILLFWISLIEATYLTVRQAPLRLASDSGNKRGEIAIKITNEKTRLVSTTTFVDTFSNVVTAITVGLILSNFFGSYGWILNALLGSLFIMIFLYLLPKAMGIENSTNMAIRLASSTDALLKTLSPIAVPLTEFASRLSRRILGDKFPVESRSLVNEFEDFLIMLERAGDVAPDAGKVIRSALASSKSSAGEFVTPANEIVSIPASSSVQDALQIMGRSGHPHLPVKDEKTGKYRGAVTFGSLSPALAAGRFSENVLNYSVRPARVEMSDATTTVMDRMQESQVTMAYVFQGEKILGLVTLTDILEVVLGLRV
jgi:putative hemolysin